MHVLLVEDDDELGSRIGRGLTQAGFVVERAANGDDGLELGLQPQIDIIVLDLQLHDAKLKKMGLIHLSVVAQ